MALVQNFSNGSGEKWVQYGAESFFLLEGSNLRPSTYLGRTLGFSQVRTLLDYPTQALCLLRWDIHEICIYLITCFYVELYKNAHCVPKRTCIFRFGN